MDVSPVVGGEAWAVTALASVRADVVCVVVVAVDNLFDLICDGDFLGSCVVVRVV